MSLTVRTAELFDCLPAVTCHMIYLGNPCTIYSVVLFMPADHLWYMCFSTVIKLYHRTQIFQKWNKYFFVLRADDFCAATLRYVTIA